MRMILICIRTSLRWLFMRPLSVVFCAESATTSSCLCRNTAGGTVESAAAQESAQEALDNCRTLRYYMSVMS